MAEEIIKTILSQENDLVNPPLPSYFVSLSVENFRCFGPRQTLRLADDNNKLYQWTVLIGENGVGKTTLLECLKLQETIDASHESRTMYVSKFTSWYTDHLVRNKYPITNYAVESHIRFGSSIIDETGDILYGNLRSSFTGKGYVVIVLLIILT